MIPRCPRLSKAGEFTPALWERFASWLEKELTARTIQPGKGYTFTQAPGGFSIDVKGGGGVAGSSVASHPFQVITQGKPGSTTGEMQWGVVYDSQVYGSLQPQGSKMSITGLLSSDSPASDDAGWRDMDPNDVIWITLDNGSLTINSLGTGGTFSLNSSAWSGADGYIEDDGTGGGGLTPPAPFRTARKVIAWSVDGTITQSITHHQVLREIVINGRWAQYFYDHSGGYPLPVA